ncbi:MAG: ABC transporter permease [Oscillospiraceae bacterium]|nr:ABC transporter permease [Oscillospiraceae bacterium]MCL2278737.1 ABC transporter permease [Oscillospiraceae bacterium]
MLIRFVIKRIIILFPVVIGISIILFIVQHIMPGDPVRALMPPDVRPEHWQAVYDAIEARLGLDRPVIEQYFRWVYSFFIRGEFGYSTMMNMSVNAAIREPLRNTIILNSFVIMFHLAIALPVGIKMAVKRGSLFDNTWQVFSLATFSLPAFFLALTLIFIFSITLGWLPVSGMPNPHLLQGRDLYIGWLRHLALPVTTLVIMSLAGAIRYIRNAMIDALSQDYIRTARSKGLSEKVVIYSHAFRNALIPISTIIVGVVFSLFAGAVITETVFGYNGIGRLLIQGVNNRDRMLIISTNMLFALINVTSILIADIVYGLVDPRIKLK